MSELKELLDTINDLRVTAKVDPGLNPASTRTAVEAMIRNAKNDLPKAEDAYKEAVMNHVIIIGVNGPGQNEFANIAKYKFGTITADYNQVKDRIITNIKKRNATNKYTNQEHFLLLDELTKIKTDYNMRTLTPPSNNGYMEGAYNGTLEDGIEKLIKVNYGNSLASAIVRREIGKTALEQNFTAKYQPVILINFNEDVGVDTKFLPRPVAVIETTAKVTEKEVKDTLTKVNMNVRGIKAKKSSPETGTKEQVNE
jgi:hypothetical protein